MNNSIKHFLKNFKIRELGMEAWSTIIWKTAFKKILTEMK